MDRSVSVLIVDDSQIVREGLRALLQADGKFTVVGEADNGREAVKAAEELRPEVIVMDVRMPELNGVQAAWLILDKSPSTRIVMLSSYTDDRFIQDASRCGAVGYLSKEVAGDKLLGMIRAK